VIDAPEQKGESPAAPTRAIHDRCEDPVSALLVGCEDKKRNADTNRCKDYFCVSEKRGCYQALLTVDWGKPKNDSVQPVCRERANGPKQKQHHDGQEDCLVRISTRIRELL
jgi:hypothetical protein